MFEKYKVKRKCRQNNWKLVELHYDGYTQIKIYYGPPDSLIDYLIAGDYNAMLYHIEQLEKKDRAWPKTKIIYEPPANTVHSTKQGPN